MWILLPALLGIVFVIQCGLNDQINKSHGLLYPITINNIVFLTCNILIISFVYFSNPTSEIPLKFKSINSFSMWYILPGILGLMIVAGTTLSVTKLGAAKTMIILVLFQITFGILWDWQILDKSLSKEKLIACVFAILTGYFANK